MNEGNGTENLYLPGEERFGFFTSAFYGIVNTVPTLRRFYRFVEGQVTSMKFESLLDIGSGQGHVLLGIMKNNQSARGMGIDPSPGMIRISMKKCMRMGLCHRVTFLPGSSRNIPGNVNFDIIYTSLSFHHWKHRAESVEQVLKRVNEGGKFLIFEITDDGSFNRKFVRSHLMERNDFIEIGKNINIVPEIVEADGYIMAAFTRE